MTIKSLTNEQITNLWKINLSGNGGKENEIAKALGHERNHQPFVDAKCPITGVLYEYKKQSGTQWFDLHKLSKLTKAQADTAILFFIHDDGKLVGAYKSTYQDVCDAINLTPQEWEWAKNAPTGAQVKYSLKLKQIKKFTCITSKLS